MEDVSKTHLPCKMFEIPQELASDVKVTEYLLESFFSLPKKIFKAKLNITSLASFSKKKNSYLEACANYQQESFSNEVLSPTRVL